MASAVGPPGSSAPVPAAEGGVNTTAIGTRRATVPPYLSPAPSAAPSSMSFPLPLEACTRASDTGLLISGVKTAKDYWKREYATLEQRKQSGKKRKNCSDVEGHDLTKRRQAMYDMKTLQPHGQRLLITSAVGESRPDVDSVEMDETLAQRIGFDNPGNMKDGLVQRLMQLLKVDVNLDDRQACQDLRQLHKAILSFGDGKCKFSDGKWALDGLQTTLYHHQVIGVSWMLSRELHPTAPRGGILADEMGLGKTIQLLACMSQNLPGKNAKASKTLIVAPKRLRCQWYNEIKSHCSNKSMKRVFVYAADKVVADSQLDDETIILTNYTQLQLQLPSPDKLIQIERLKLKGDPKWKALLREHSRGCLFKIDWHRVVLDEAHAINNRNSKTSRACRLLIRRCSWILTGTPLTNEKYELFPYLDFIRSEYNNFGEYQVDMGGDIANEEQVERFRATYREISMGRRVTDRFMGQLILQIPEARPTELLKVDFSPLEADMYRRNRDELARLRDLAKTLKGTRAVGLPAVPKGELHKRFNYARYFTSHPALVDPGYLSLQAPRPEEHTPQTDVQISVERADLTVIHYFCRVCCNALVDPHIGTCGHAFCRPCLKKIEKGPKNNRCCVTCGLAPTAAKPGRDECYCHATDQFERLMQRFAGPGSTSKARRNKRVRKPGDDEFGLQPRLAQRRTAGKRKRRSNARKGQRNKGRRAKAKKSDPIEKIRANAGGFLRECDKRPWDPIPHSAKTSATLDLVKKWQQEAPDDKIIIFVQWIPVLSFLGRMLFQNGFKFVYLWGEMDTDQQEMCIRAFQQVTEIKIMLISVTCGAHGLNLTAANRAIVFDHWWHEGWERQAFARVHRIGQTKVVHTVKLVAAESMDETILVMQNTKSETIRAAVGDNTDCPKRSEICDGLHEDDQVHDLMELARLDDMGDDESEGTNDDADDKERSTGESESDSAGDDSDDDDDDDYDDYDDDNDDNNDDDDDDDGDGDDGDDDDDDDYDTDDN